MINMEGKMSAVLLLIGIAILLTLVSINLTLIEVGSRLTRVSEDVGMIRNVGPENGLSCVVVDDEIQCYGCYAEKGTDGGIHIHCTAPPDMPGFGA